MIKKNIIIINFNSLYEILEEIKENLTFKIVKYENKDDFIKDSVSKIQNSLIIYKFDHKHLLNQSICDKNFLNLENYPLSLIKLIELINVQFIKLRFNQQSKIMIKGYDLDLNSKFLSKNKILLKLTEKEIEIILYLDDNKNKQSVLDLQKNIWYYSPNMETHTVETHIYRLRKKISDKFNDKNFIISQKKGYFIS